MQIENFFQSANAETIATLVPQFYREDVQFRDPLVALQGREQLIEYYRRLYEGAHDVQFSFGEHLQEGDSHMLAWTMTASTGHLNQGKPFRVDGVSHIKYSKSLVYFHRDYFDLSAMFYERLPVIGGVMGWLKKRAGEVLSHQG